MFALLRKDENEQTNPTDFFKAQKWENKFLETEEGKKYVSPFNALKTKYILLESGGIYAEKLEQDNIVPQELMYRAYKDICLTTLAINQKNDSG